MATFPRISKSKQQKPTSSLILLLVSISAISIGLFWLFSSSSFPLSNNGAAAAKLSSSSKKKKGSDAADSVLEKKYLYWGDRIDCPGKHCASCEGLGHQESSLRCALEEALFLNRVFVMPSRMCINPIHNKKGILHHSGSETSEERWAASSCAMDSLYDLGLIFNTVPVILDNSKTWHRVFSTSLKLGERGIAHVEGTSRNDLKVNSLYSNVLLINRTASPLSW
ncbi:uncharacterized protein M6B38_377335 [Iris pallida]|uniref:Uncharacterized protein n=1 Tax=Iris pallida TaxID=29817 RepID=A0AAX6GAE6_IRIPA|nr:uncharacterized protein M6B38_377335 [Iris pallida]